MQLMQQYNRVTWRSDWSWMQSPYWQYEYSDCIDLDREMKNTSVVSSLFHQLPKEIWQIISIYASDFYSASTRMSGQIPSPRSMASDARMQSVRKLKKMLKNALVEYEKEIGTYLYSSFRYHEIKKYGLARNQMEIERICRAESKHGGDEKVLIMSLKGSISYSLFYYGINNEGKLTLKKHILDEDKLFVDFSPHFEDFESPHADEDDCCSSLSELESE